MPFKFSNAATATLASSITSSSTTLSVTAGLGALFPSMAAGEFFAGVLVDASNNVEIVRVTARAGDVMTVTRAQEGTTARAYSAGSRFEVRLTSAGLNNFLQLDGAQTVTGQKTFTQTIIGNLQGNVTGNLSGNVTGNVTGNLTGNAGTVTNGVYTNTSQTISGDKTFTGVTFFNGSVTRATNLFVGQSETLVYEASQNALTIRTGAAGAYAFATFAANGDLTATGNVTANSDERLKQNWRDLPADFLERLAEVKMGIYDRKDTGETQAGVSAQAMRTLLSPVVREGTDGMLSVAYGNAALVAAVKLASEVVSLRRELNELKGA